MSGQDGAEAVAVGDGYAAATRRVDVDAVPPALAAEGHFLWLRPDEPDLLAAGATATVTVDGPERFRAAGDRLDAVFDAVDAEGVPPVARPRACGGLAFFEASTAPEWAGFPGARFVLPRVQLVVDDDAYLTATLPAAEREALSTVLDEWTERVEAASETAADEPLPAATDFDWALPRADWEQAVGTAVDRIRADGLDKVVLAQALTVGLDGPVPFARVLPALRERYPSCTTFAVSPEAGGTLFGATPETLVSLRDGRVETEALAGSTARGDTAGEDEALAERMLDDEKYQVENRIVADAIADALAPVAVDVTVEAPSIKRIANLQHLHRPIAATVADADVLDLAERLHPTPAVGGQPPDAAAAAIRDVEPFDRGWYAAPVGWVDAHGDGTFAVAIRSGVATGESVTLFGGAGIVDGSDPATEYGEVTSRFDPILEALEVSLPAE